MTILLNEAENIIYRKYSSFDSINQISLRTLINSCYPDPPQDVFERILSKYRQGNPIYLALFKETLVGFVYCIQNSKGGYLESLCVHPDFQKRNIANNLVNTLIEDNPGVISLTTRIVDFFKKFSFVPVKILEDGSTFMVRF